MSHFIGSIPVACEKTDEIINPESADAGADGMHEPDADGAAPPVSSLIGLSQNLHA